MGERQQAHRSYEPVEHRTVSIHALIPSPDNYNEHPQEQLNDLKASLRRFGQVDDVIVKALPDGKYQIVAHEGVTTAGLQLLEAGECLHFKDQWNITIVPQSWTPLDVKGYMAASNELPRKSVPDDAALVALLQEQSDAGYDLATMGKDEETLREMLAGLGDEIIAEGAPDVQFKEYDESVEDDLDTEMCKECGKLCLKGKK